MAENKVVFDYFHGYESEQFAFYRIPKVLFTNDYFKELSSDAKVLYGLMLDRMSLSVKNGWLDQEDKVYIIFTLEQVMEYMNCGKDKGVKILAELDTKKGIGLIERVRRGLGKPALIYVKSFLIKENVEESNGVEVPEREGLESRSPEVGKNDSIYTDINNTDFSDTDINPIHLSRESTKEQKEGMDWMDVMRAYTQLVKGKLLKVGYPHIQYVLETLHRNTTKVRNVKAYLLTCVFNAPSTINS